MPPHPPLGAFLRPLRTLPRTYLPSLRPTLLPARPLLTRGVVAGYRPAEAAAVDPYSVTDYGIPYPFVRLVDGEGKLLQPEPPASIMRNVQRETHELIVVNIPDEGSGANIPIVKIVNKEERREKEITSQQKQKVRRKLAIADKEVQVSWQADIGDVNQKISLAQSILSKGNRVQMVFANRSRRESPSPERVEEVLALVEEKLNEVGKRWKDDERRPGLAALFWGPLPSVRNELEKKVMTEEEKKRKEKEAQKEQKLEAKRQKEERRKQRDQEAEAKRAAEAQDMRRRMMEQNSYRQKRRGGLFR
ncbi:hypothetical protein IAT38_001610 [Cryptococcus sp. DSM 104549]